MDPLAPPNFCGTPTCEIWMHRAKVRLTFVQLFFVQTEPKDSQWPEPHRRLRPTTRCLLRSFDRRPKSGCEVNGALQLWTSNCRSCDQTSDRDLLHGNNSCVSQGSLESLEGLEQQTHRWQENRKEKTEGGEGVGVKQTKRHLGHSAKIEVLLQWAVNKDECSVYINTGSLIKLLETTRFSTWLMQLGHFYWRGSQSITHSLKCGSFISIISIIVINTTLRWCLL